MKHTISHDLPMPLAEQATRMAFDAYREKLPEYDPRVTWTDADHAQVSFSVKGMKLGGAVALHPGAIDLELEVPFLLRLFQKRAIDVIDREVREWLEKAKAGELTPRTG